MQGKIIKGIAGFYYVYTEEDRSIYECKAKGAFRREGIKPLPGDNVLLDVVDAEARTGNIREILNRNNMLVRPAVANVDQSMILFSIVKPDPNYNLLDRFLITMERQEIPCFVCFNKKDIAAEYEQAELRKSYEGCGFTVLFVSAEEKEGMEDVLSLLKGKTTVVAGPSGVGKSTVINYLCPEAHMETGAISRKIDRGKHTTRHSEIFALGEHTFIIDTPGFTALNLAEMKKEELKNFYPEFADYADTCRFRECSHIHEPVCGVKEALEAGAISQLRYDNYLRLYEELALPKRY